MLKNRATKLTCLLIAFVWMTIVIGSSYAYFIDSVVVTGNVITAGNLKASLEYMDKTTSEWKDASNAAIFSYQRWEPGYTDVQYIRISNTGDLAFQYELNVVPDVQTPLMDVIDVYYGDVEAGNSIQDRTSFWNQVDNGSLTKVGTLSDLLANEHGANYGVLLASQNETACMVLHMQEEAGNEYQNLAVGKGFTVQLFATQWTEETDSFGKDYDKGAEAEFPELNIPTSMTIQVQPVNGLVPYAVTFNDAKNGVSAVVPAGAKMADSTTSLTLVVEKMSSRANVTLDTNEDMVSYNVKVDGLAADNTVPVIITMGEVLSKGLNMGNYKLYHVENGQTNPMTLTASPANHNDFAYDPAEGVVTVAMASFSEVALVANEENPWNGETKYDWYDADAEELMIANADQLAAFGKIVGGMADGIERDSFEGQTVKLLADINLGYGVEGHTYTIFHPIGYYYKDGDSTVKSFEGTFDGNGHKIANFYQNTWEIKGDYDGTYYKDAMGLFGYVSGGTVRNLTVDNFSSDGEFTPTGVIAAYADGNSTFENIAITNCNPRVYNTGNGGIIGIAGNSNDQGTQITLRNITVDNSNKISALWGSYDVACGGLVGMFRGNANGGTGKIHFENCHVSAQIDVYNDVCGNYQYYAYRYAGMIIGSVRHNTTNADGKIIPNMTGITATGCTVNYGDWNDYYYCEFVKNGHPSYSGENDYKFSRVPNNEIDASKGKENATCIGHNHTEVEDNQAVYLPFHQLFTGYSWGVSSIGLEKYSGIVTDQDITEGEQEESVEKFETKFTGDFLYRVGNQNAVSIGSLFAAKDGVTISNSGVWVSVEPLDETMKNVSGTFTANTTDWTEGTIQFSGTGVVKVTIQDYNFCTPTDLYLEVVDATNTTSAASATKNNVVLLQDCGFGTLEVSGGYTLYGNGFKMEAKNDVMYDAMGVGFVTLKNGTLDNVQVICPNFSYAIIYNSQIQSSENTAVPSDSSIDARGNVRSAVMADGNSKIVNSYIHGGRAAVFLRSGNLVIEGSTISGGAAANIHTMSAQSLTLRNATLIQKPFKANVNDTSKTIMGFSGLFECDDSGNSTPLCLEGTLIQDAWINESYEQYVPATASSIVSTALDKTDYLHDLDNDGTKESLNLGFAYIPQNYGGNTSANVTDDRTNKSTAPYDSVSISNYATVYSYKNSNGTSSDFVNVGAYIPSAQGPTPPTVTFTDANADRVFETKFDTSDNRWESTLTVNLDNGDYTFNFDKLLAQKYGSNLSYTVKTESGTDVDTSKDISLTASGTTNYIITVDENNQTKSRSVSTTGVHTLYFTLVATKTSIPEPEVADTTGGTPLLVVKSKASDWSCAIPALEGIKVRYYTSVKDAVTLDLANLTPASTGKQNGTNNYWETTKDGYKLKVTCGYIHDTKQVYGMPVVVKNDEAYQMYFTISSTNGYVSTNTSARTVTLTYEFTDPNGKTLTFSKTWQFNYADYSSGAQYKYSDFVNGTLNDVNSSNSGSGSGSGEGCVTPDTLITLANGTQVRVDSLTGNEKLLVWNMETGALDEAPIMFLDNDPETEYEVVHLYFSDGTDVRVIYEHGFWDYDLNKYVYLDKDAAQYIGHTFAKQSGNDLAKVQLTNVVIETERTTAWSPVTVDHLCYFVNGMLSMPGGVGGLFNIFDVDPATMAYDMEALARDIETYGLYTYEELNAIVELPEDMFYAAGGPYMKISMGKGNLTMDELIAMIERYTKFFK